jgi:hypothetical protein
MRPFEAVRTAPSVIVRPPPGICQRTRGVERLGIPIRTIPPWFKRPVSLRLQEGAGATEVNSARWSKPPSTLAWHRAGEQVVLDPSGLGASPFSDCSKHQTMYCGEMRGR